MAKHIVIVDNDGVQAAKDLATIGKLIYVGNTMQLIDHEGELLGEARVSDIRKITFTSNSTATEEHSVDNQITIYPNPTQDILILQGIAAQALRIYDLQGRLLKTTEGTEISVGDMADGIYLLQVGTQVVRFIKQ